MLIIFAVGFTHEIFYLANSRTSFVAILLLVGFHSRHFIYPCGKVR
jgi:hypothetical protein